MRHHQLQQLPKRQRGAVAVVVGIAIFVLVGMIGLALDLGQMFVNKTELQNAADACALAAARELDGTSDGFDRGDAVGRLVGRENLVGFQKTQVALDGDDITYSNQLDSGFSNKPPLDAKFAKCEVERNDIRMWFMGVRGFDDQIVRAHAVATLAPSQTSCAIPIGMCMESETAPTFGLVKGQWYGGKFKQDPSDPSGATYTGSFDWIDFTVPGGFDPEDDLCSSGGGGGGANELRCLLSGPGQCQLPPVNTLVGQQGQIGSAAEAWNTRFGLYLGSPNITEELSKSPPDFTGTAYTKVGIGAASETTWPNEANAYSDYQVEKMANSPYDLALNPANIKGDNSYTSASTTQLATYGSQRRVALAPIVDCTMLAGTNPQYVQIKGYACVLMLSPIKAPTDVVMEYLGAPSDSGSPCSSFGLAGGTGPLVPVLVQ